jgi:hypothetical protein
MRPKKKTQPFDFKACLSRLDNDFETLQGGTTASLQDAIASFEGELGFALEPSYRHFVETLGCASVVANEAAWPRPEALEIRPRWQMEYGIELYGLAPRPPRLDVRARTADLRARGMDGRVAVLGVLGTGLQLTHDAHGRYAWLDGNDALEPTEETFATIVSARVQTLQADKDRLVAERGKARKPSKAPNSRKLAALLIENPWDADELLEDLDGAQREEVRDIILARLAKKLADEIVAAAATRPGAATTAAILQALTRADDDEDLREVIAEALQNAR